ncbi:MAG: hypothetical protein C4291_14950 [Candidatus Dadabacteria bacterium]
MFSENSAALGGIADQLSPRKGVVLMTQNPPLQTNHEFLGRGVDYLGFLGTQLRNLRGFTTLAYELIQNADDTEGASEMRFHFSPRALVVDNDGVFSDCGQVSADQCPWLEERGSRCDFHSFRLVAGGEKRGRADTTGAFGVGFLAVYQVTDHPELISQNRHWVLDENQPEDRRIRVCPGCPTCKTGDLPGTRFILPWALDAGSPIRVRLQVDAITHEAITEFSQELLKSLPTAMLFLRRLTRIEILNNGDHIESFERIIDQNQVLIAKGTKTDHWFLIQDNFDDKAKILKKDHHDKIESKRLSTVIVAVPQDFPRSGVVCAFLPTQYETGMPLHINADFFTTSDRKSIVLSDDHDYQTRWNRAAIEAATEAVSEQFTEILHFLKPEQTWRLIEASHSVHREVQEGKRDRAFYHFWTSLAAAACTTPSIRSSQGRDYRPAEVFLLQHEEEQEATAVLEGLDLPIVHQSLRPFFGVLRNREIGVRVLTLGDLATALRGRSFNLPADRDTLAVLWRELERLFMRGANGQGIDATRELDECAIVLDTRETLWPCRKIYQADSATIELFSAFGGTIPFVSPEMPTFAFIRQLCPEFSVLHALNFLRELSPADIQGAYDSGRVSVGALLNWFSERLDQLLTDQQNRTRFTKLPIFPTSSGLKPLSQMALPGGFSDPLGLAELVSTELVQNYHRFLESLGVKELTFRVYVKQHIPGALSQSGSLSLVRKRELVRLLADHLGEIRDDQSIRAALCALPLVECEDGVYWRPNECYLPSDQVRKVLGSSIHIAVLPAGRHDSYRDLYQWLGVEDVPRIDHIIEKVRAIVKQPATPKSIEAVAHIVEHLGKRSPNPSDEEKRQLEWHLSKLAWLPAQGHAGRWFEPSKLHAVFRQHLFRSQGVFLDLPQEVQQNSAKFLKQLGVKTEPSVFQVVKHLLHCSENNSKELNSDVYKFLNDHADDSALTMLTDRPCLLLDNGQYVRPQHAFLGDHPFGRFRYRLGSDFLQFRKLMDRLGVREHPSADDALLVLQEIADDRELTSQSLTDETLETIMACWRVLNEALRKSEVNAQKIALLKNLQVIPSDKRLLRQPKMTFFEDRPGLATKFGDRLAEWVIKRRDDLSLAMAQAGVRALSQVVSTDVVEKLDPTESPEVVQRVLARLPLLQRVLASEQTDSRHACDILQGLQCRSVAGLKIRYRFKEIFPPVVSDVEDAQAHYLREEGVLYVLRRDEMPWPSIGRELALALFPETEPGRLAMSFKDVLSAETDTKASVLLDDCGFSPIGDNHIRSNKVASLEHGFGGLVNPIDKSVGVVDTNADVTPGPVEDSQTSDGDRVLQNSRILSSSDTRINTVPNPFHSEGHGASSAHVQAEDLPRPSRSSQSRSRLRTYVIQADRIPQNDRDISLTSSTRDDVARAGVARVLEYERSRGRYPKEMTHFNEGYDVESTDASGNTVRYIEVKSLAGDWPDTAARLTRPQFEMAEEKGELYWLYVVERAQRDDFRIYRICNPARQANEFLFDDGWKALSENEEP